MKQKKKLTKKAPRPRAPKSPARTVAFKRVQLCGGIDRPKTDSAPDTQPPTDPLAAKQLLAAGALALGPIQQLEETLAVGRNHIHPFSMKDMLAKLGADDVLAVAVWARETAEWINTIDPAKAAAGLCQFTFELVEKLNQLEGSDVLRPARKRIPAWPTNVTRAGVGTDAKVLTRPESRAGTRHEKSDQSRSDWRRWVDAACEAARFNVRYGVAFVSLKQKSKLVRIVDIAPKRMDKKMPVEWYETPGGRVLLWPWFMDNCFAVPDELRPESLGAYKLVMEGLLLWHLIFHCGMKDGAALLGEELNLPPRTLDGRMGADYDPEVANRIIGQMRRTLGSLARNPRKRTAV